MLFLPLYHRLDARQLQPFRRRGDRLPVLPHPALAALQRAVLAMSQHQLVEQHHGQPCSYLPHQPLRSKQQLQPLSPGLDSRLDLLPVSQRSGHGQQAYVQKYSQYRRSLIGHYIAGEAKKVAEFYHPALRMDGSVITLEKSQEGSSCGIWVDEEGRQVIEEAGIEGVSGRTE